MRYDRPFTGSPTRRKRRKQPYRSRPNQTPRGGWQHTQQNQPGSYHAGRPVGPVLLRATAEQRAQLVDRMETNGVRDTALAKALCLDTGNMRRRMRDLTVDAYDLWNTALDTLIDLQPEIRCPVCGETVKLHERRHSRQKARLVAPHADQAGGACRAGGWTVSSDWS